MSGALAAARREAEEALDYYSMEPYSVAEPASIAIAAIQSLLAALPWDGASAPDEALTTYCDVCESDRRVPCHSTVTGEVALYPHPERVVAARAARAAKGGE